MIDPWDQTAALHAHALRLECMLENVSVGICLFAADQKLVASNRRYAEMYGIDPERITPGMTMPDIIRVREPVGSVPDIPPDALHESILDAVRHEPTEGTLRHLRNGRVMRIRHRPMPDGGWVATHEDVTERHIAEQRLVHLAHHDALTGLPNRTLLRERLEAILAHGAGAASCAVMSLDLDNFKSVNDTLGHAIGDEILRAVTERLRHAIAPGDLVARLGNNDFVVVQRELRQPAEAMALAERLVARLARPFHANGNPVGIGVSIGITIAPRDGTEPDHLLRNAALALSAAKAGGRGRVEQFVPSMDAAAQRRRILEYDLRKALDHGEMELAYQPVANLRFGRVGGFEALLRWNRPLEGRVSPAEFIPLAEQNDLIVPIGTWVLRTACAEAANWPDGMSVAVNVSAAQFQSRDLPDVVAGALRASGLPPWRLELEVTETAMMQNWQHTADVLQQIKRLGVRVSMDDFGTGYSSLSYLRRFPFDKIKIDQSFIRELSANGQTIAIVRAILALCRALGMTTTAEGVETQEHFDILAAEGCAEIQGYLLSEPRPARDVPAMIDRLNDGPLASLRRAANGGIDPLAGVALDAPASAVRRPVFAAAFGGRG